MDYYRTSRNEISYKPNMDALPELDFNFKETEICTLLERKPYLDAEGNEKVSVYFPGFCFVMSLVRDPWPKIILSFFPCIVTSMLVIAVYQVPYNLKSDRLILIAIILLIFI